MTDDKAAIERVEHEIGAQCEMALGTTVTFANDLKKLCSLAREALRWREACQEPDLVRLDELFGSSNWTLPPNQQSEYAKTRQLLDALRQEVNNAG